MVVFDENCWDERALWIAYLLLASQWCRAPGNISSLVKFMTLAASAQANVFGSYVQSNSSSSWLLYTLHKPSITGPTRFTAESKGEHEDFFIFNEGMNF